MLKQISIKNFAIFKNAIMEPGSGYNVITGESGAGKSIIVNALSLIRGTRAYREMIRTGEDYAMVEAVFELSENKMKQLETNESIFVITRQINLNKSSECRINGKIRSLNEVVEITEKLIDIHGQYENQTLADPDNHLTYLDAFAGEKLEEVMRTYQKSLKEYNKLTKQILDMSGSDSERERNKELYNFQLKEIDAFGLENFSEEEFNEKRTLLKNNEKFKNESEKAYNMLSVDEKSPYDVMTEVHKLLTGLPENKDLFVLTEKLKDASYLLLDFISELRDFSEKLEFDRFDFENLNDTFENLKKLKRKYGNSIENILEYRNTISNELVNIENYEKNNNEILKKIIKLEETLLSLDSDMLFLRKETASNLKIKLLNELKEMGMEDSQLIINISSSKHTNELGFTEFGNRGLSRCEFLISLNKGLEPQALGRVASGGEMSRIMLAFKTLFTFKDETDTVVFDEIDSGLSGEASRTVAAKLTKLATSKQILCITHLPQIAARAGNHFLIIKDSSGDITEAEITKAINREDIINQIASLTDGQNITEESLNHAANLYEQFN